MNARIWLIALCFMQTVYARDATNIESNFDVGRECKTIHSKLPAKLSAIKKLPTFLREKTTKTNDYGCYPQACNLHQMSFSGFDLVVLETKDIDPYFLTATTTSAKARLFENIYVGQSLEELERFAKTSIPKDKSPIYIGECVGFKIWHDGKFVNKIFADCDCT